ncbi:hypothetical protein D9754_15195 [Planomicrobium sp. Y74]|nr:hypothetical protein D9754_15195 [Planomicrobium sp. Y74]
MQEHIFALRCLALIHLKVVLRDMEQNSEDAQGSKRSVKIHSDEVKRVRVSSARAPRQAKLFCGISVMNTQKRSAERRAFLFFIEQGYTVC